MSEDSEVVIPDEDFQDVPEVIAEGEADVEQEESVAPADEDRTEDQVPDITGTDYVDPMTTSMDGIDDLPVNEEAQDLGKLTEENEDEFHDAEDNLYKHTKNEDTITGEQTAQLDAQENSGFVAEVQVDELAEEAPVPEEVTPADTAPADEAPADAVPTDEKSADAAPADATLVDASPAEAAPADAGSTDAVPADAAQADEALEDAAAPTENAPVEEAVAEEEISVGEPALVTEETPAAETITKEDAPSEEPQVEETAPVEETAANENIAPVEDAVEEKSAPPEDAIPVEEPIVEQAQISDDACPSEEPPITEEIAPKEPEVSENKEQVEVIAPVEEPVAKEEIISAEKVVEESSTVEEEKVETHKEFELKAPPEGKPRTPNELDEKPLEEAVVAPVEETESVEVPPTPKSAAASEKVSVPPTPKSAEHSEKSSVPPTPKSAVPVVEAELVEAPPTPKSAAASEKSSVPPTPKSAVPPTPKSASASTPKVTGTPKNKKAFNFEEAPTTPKSMKAFDSIPATNRTTRASKAKKGESQTPRTPVEPVALAEEPIAEPVEEKQATPISETTPEAEPQPEPESEKEPSVIDEPEAEPEMEKEPSSVAEAEPEPTKAEETLPGDPDETVVADEELKEPSHVEEPSVEPEEEVKAPVRATLAESAPRERHEPAAIPSYQSFDEDTHKTIPPPRLPTADSFSSWTPTDKATYTAMAPHAGDPAHKYRNEYTSTTTYRPSTTYTSHFDDIVNTGAFSNALYSTSRLIERSRSRTRERRNAMRSQRSASNYFRYTSQMPTPTRSRDYSSPPSATVSRAPSRAGSFVSFMDYAGAKNYELSRANSRNNVVYDNSVALSRSSSRGNVDFYLGGGRLSRVDSYVADMNTPYEYTAPASYERYRSSSVSRPVPYSPVTGYTNPLYMDSDARRRMARYESVAVTPIGARSMYEGHIGHLERSLSREKINKERLRHEYSALSNKLDMAMRQMQLLRTNSYTNLHAHMPRTSVYQSYYQYL